jgi:hypothetical protein
MTKPCQITSVSVRKPVENSSAWRVRVSGRAGANTLHVYDRGEDIHDLLADIENVFTGAAVVKGLIPDV